MPFEIVAKTQYGIEQLDCELTAMEAKEYLPEYRMAMPGFPIWRRFQKPTRYFVKPSGGAYYSTEELKPLVKAAGGQNVRTARLNGWSNQARVVTFSGYSREERAVKEALDSAGYMTIVHEKDW